MSYFHTNHYNPKKYCWLSKIFKADTEMDIVVFFHINYIVQSKNDDYKVGVETFESSTTTKKKKNIKLIWSDLETSELNSENMYPWR